MTATLKTFFGITLVLAFLWMTGCARHQENAMLQEAQAAFAAARNDPNVLQSAPLEIRQASEDLRRAEELQSASAPEEEVSHQAYLARQRVEIAQETAQLKEAQKSIENAETQRQQVLLQARERELQTARQQAEAGKRELQEARRIAQEREQRLTEQQREQEMAELRRRAERTQQLEEQIAELQEMSPERTERGIVLTMPGVLFEFDKAEVLPGADRSIEKLAQVLTENPEHRIMVEGFTDNVGPEEYNKQLSQERAEAVRDALVERGINPERIETRGYGEDYPVASNETAAGRQMNRRVEIVIADPSETVSRK